MVPYVDVVSDERLTSPNGGLEAVFSTEPRNKVARLSLALPNAAGDGLGGQCGRDVKGNYSVLPCFSGAGPLFCPRPREDQIFPHSVHKDLIDLLAPAVAYGEHIVAAPKCGCVVPSIFAQAAEQVSGRHCSGHILERG